MHRLGIQAFQPVLIVQALLCLNVILYAGSRTGYVGLLVLVVLIAWRSKYRCRLSSVKPVSAIMPYRGRKRAISLYLSAWTNENTQCRMGAFSVHFGGSMDFESIAFALIYPLFATKTFCDFIFMLPDALR